VWVREWSCLIDLPCRRTYLSFHSPRGSYERGKESEQIKDGKVLRIISLSPITMGPARPMDGAKNVRIVLLFAIVVGHELHSPSWPRSHRRTGCSAGSQRDTITRVGGTVLACLALWATCVSRDGPSHQSISGQFGCWRF
jgi:hypothetical protein